MELYSDPAEPSFTVCIVDDHIEFRSFMATALEARAIEVVAAVGTLADGLREIPVHQPHLAVIDNRLPDGRGIDLCRDLSRVVPETVLIVHTGLITPDEHREAIAAGASDVVVKTIRCHQLLAAIESYRSGRKPFGSP